MMVQKKLSLQQALQAIMWVTFLSPFIAITMENSTFPLPDELVVTLFLYLDYVTLLKLCDVCKRFYGIVDVDIMPKLIRDIPYAKLQNAPTKYSMQIPKAIDITPTHKVAHLERLSKTAIWPY